MRHYENCLDHRAAFRLQVGQLVVPEVKWKNRYSQLLRRLLFSVLQLRSALLLHHSYTMFLTYSSRQRQKAPLNFCSLCFANSVTNIVIMLRIFITIAVGITTCERSVSKLKLIKNYSNMSTLRMRNVAIPSIEQQLTDEKNFDIAVKKFANKKAKVIVEKIVVFI